MNEHLRTFVVVNPASASGATGRRWNALARGLDRTIGAFDHAVTDGPLHATALTRAALDKGFEMIVAVGGDGTLNEVVCGFFDGCRPVAPDAVLGVIPHGTGCDFARSMGIGRTLERACDRLAGRAAKLIDVGHVRFLDHQGRCAERVFLNVLSFGCGGAVAQSIATGAAKRMCGALSFMLASAWTLLRYRDQTVTLSLDGGTPEQISVTNLAVCNGGFFGGGMWAAPGARMDDGRFDLTIWSGFGVKGVILKRRSIYDGTHVHDPGTRLRRAKTLVATSDERVLLEIDGESAGRLPVTIENLPGALRLKV